MTQRFVQLFAIAALVGAMGITGAAHAQRPFKIGVSGGASVPVGDMGDGANTGFVLNANIGVRATGTPFTLQAEGGWNQWGAKGSDGTLRTLSLTANVLYDLPMVAPIKPYLIGLGGLYHFTASTDVGGGGTLSASSNKFGLGIGGGLRFPMSGFDTFIEARYTHALDTSVSFVPITFGVRF